MTKFYNPKYLPDGSIILIDEKAEIKEGDWIGRNQEPYVIKVRGAWNNNLDLSYRKIIAASPSLNIPVDVLNLERFKEQEIENKKGQLVKEYYQANWRDYQYLNSDEAFHKGIEIGVWANIKAAPKRYTEEQIDTLRNRLVSILPTGDVSTWDLIKAIKDYLQWWDNYLQSFSQIEAIEIEMEEIPIADNDSDWDFSIEKQPKLNEHGEVIIHSIKYK